MERYLDSCSETEAQCSFCKIELAVDQEWEKEKEEDREMFKRYLPQELNRRMLKCPKCGVSWSEDNPWIYFSVDKFVKKISEEHKRPSLLRRIFSLWR